MVRPGEEYNNSTHQRLPKLFLRSTEQSVKVGSVKRQFLFLSTRLSEVDVVVTVFLKGGWMGVDDTPE